MRHARALATAAILLCLLADCRKAAAQGEEGHITVAPHAPAAVQAGRAALGLGGDRDGFLFVPHDTAAGGVPLLVLLHGATQRAALFERLVPLADSMGVAILAPDSRAMTWDAVRGDFGPDVEFLQRAIGRAFDRARIDSCRVVIGGFSDGASYALSLGIRNAGAFHGVVAFSPGFIIPAKQVGQLPVFLRHGTADQILPIDATSRRISAALRDANFELDYKEFDGPHTVRPADAHDAMEWVKRRSCDTKNPTGAPRRRE